MKRIFVIIIVSVLMGIPQSVCAQFQNLKTSSDELVEAAIKEAIVIVKTQYCIIDTETNQKYGRNGQDYFNTLLFAACKTDNGIIIGHNVLFPWKADKAFDKYNNNKKYQPLLDNILTVYSLKGENEYNVNISTDLSTNSDSTLICIKTIDSKADGLMLSEGTNAATNWIAWVEENSDDGEKSIINTTLAIVKKTINLSNGEALVESPNPMRSYKGGFYITAKVVSVGIVEFSLAGFIIVKDGKWTIIPVNAYTFTNSSDTPVLIETPEIINQEDGLTPVKGDRKNKKKKLKVSKK